jgi:inhibitor of KinA
VSDWPLFRAVGEAALLVELGDRIDDAVNRRILALDALVGREMPAGVTELVPAYASLLLHFDPLLTDHGAVEEAVRALVPQVLQGAVDGVLAGRERVIPVRYDGPDLEAAAAQLELAPEEVVKRHLAGLYRVYMCGFAPGYAYLGALDERLRLPRKLEIVRDVPAGTLIIAGAQCIVTTQTMPTGWWRIGRSEATLFDPSLEMPFLLAPGDRVRFVVEGG